MAELRAEGVFEEPRVPGIKAAARVVKNVEEQGAAFERSHAPHAGGDVPTVRTNRPMNDQVEGVA